MSASKITSIEKQKKDADRFNVFINNEFAFGIYSDSLVKYGLRSGDELTEDKINEIRKYDEINFGKKAALRYLGYKPRSSKNVFDKLKKLELSESSVLEVINWLVSINYLNDEIFTKQFIESKLKKKPIGKRLLKYKLSETGINKNIIDENIDLIYSDENELDFCTVLLKKYVPKIKKGDNFEKKKKSFQYLVSRGFNLTQAKKAVDLFFNLN